MAQRQHRESGAIAPQAVRMDQQPSGTPHPHAGRQLVLGRVGARHLMMWSRASREPTRNTTTTNTTTSKKHYYQAAGGKNERTV